MSPALAALVTALVVGHIAWHWGRAAAPRDPHALRVLLGKEPNNTATLGPGPEREQMAALEDQLVKAGWVHKDWVNDPEHYDPAGRYRWWGV